MIKHYIAIARTDHWFKNAFMLPGMALAWIYSGAAFDISLFFKIVFGILSTCFIASANYTINEWLDAPFDKFHPVKKNRPSVVAGLKAKYVYIEYFLFVLSGLMLASAVSISFMLVEIFFLLMGFIYNVAPFRTKDKPYIDVISESINNPIRFLLGWMIFVSTPFPPSSLLICYWMGGAFLMATKRYAEYRFINNPELAGLYRKSFRYYNEDNLLISIFFYALCSAFFLAVFLIKYRIELLLSMPLFALLFAWYLKIGFKENSPVQNPEKLYHEKKFMGFLVILVIILLALLKFDIPWLGWFLQISIP